MRQIAFDSSGNLLFITDWGAYSIYYYNWTTPISNTLIIFYNDPTH